MTEKNYGGANSFGFKGRGGLKKFLEVSFSKKSSEEKNKNMEVDEFGISKEALRDYLKAGEISKKVKEYIKEIVKKDVLILEIAEKIEGKIRELGGGIAFPTNISIDEVAAHYTPAIGDETRASGLIKIDLGVEVNGYIADTAVSFDLTEDNKHKDIIELNNRVLEEAIKRLGVGSPLKTIGNTISSLVEEDGRFKVIRNLSGHCLEQNELHAGLSVINLKNENETPLENIAIAIEPFLTEGRGEIFEGKSSDIYVLKNEKLPRDKDARIMLNYILENFRTNPFCKRWLDKAGLLKINYCLAVLSREGILHNFPILIEKERKVVSQAEHTVVFADKVYVTTK